jgi:hypothetical protein
VIFIIKGKTGIENKYYQMSNTKEIEIFSDIEIILKILHGEEALFEILIRRNNRFIYKIGRSYGYGIEDTHDLVQETLTSYPEFVPKGLLQSNFRSASKNLAQKRSCVYLIALNHGILLYEVDATLRDRSSRR